MVATVSEKIANGELTDWHSHILPGIDDGPVTIDESVAMAAALSKAGFTRVYCTPHLIKGLFDADNDTVRKSVAGLQARLTQDNIALELFTGREYYLDEYCLDYLNDPLPLGATRYILIEVPSTMSPEYVKEVFYRIKSSGYIPMIAHPERCALFTLSEKKRESLYKMVRNVFSLSGSKLGSKGAEPELSPLLSYLKDIGCAFQGSLGSFAGMYGDQARQAVMSLHGAGLYTHFGTDVHSLVHLDLLARVMTKDYCPASTREV